MKKKAATRRYSYKTLDFRIASMDPAHFSAYIQHLEFREQQKKLESINLDERTNKKRVRVSYSASCRHRGVTGLYSEMVYQQRLGNL